MNQISVQAQVDAIREATADALRSKESALKFLVDAGIINVKKRRKVVKEQESQKED